MAPSIPETMKAAQLIEFNSKTGIQITRIPVPTPGPNDALVKIGAAGWCHTDYQVWEGTYQSPLPIVPSHEPVGTIVALGSQAQAEGKWKIGDRVGILLFRHACKHCAKCTLTGDIRFCENGDFAGLKGDGGMAEYAIGDCENMCRLPEGIEWLQGAPLMCAGATVWAAIQAAHLPPGAPIAIIGIGGLGTLAVQFAAALNHPVLAIDNRPEGLALATAFPHRASLVLSSTDPDALTKLKSSSLSPTIAAGIPAVVSCTDDMAVNEWALKLLQPNGVFVPLGLNKEGFRCDAFDLVFGQIRVQGSVVSTRAQAQEMLDFVAEKGVRSWVNEVELERAGGLPEMHMDGGLKGRLVVRISED